ncbi:S-adenosyl-L-methionine-dependent methyltransferase [Pyronema domesticum]|nr:S-adenosyl-L-methionine-dependent methyltransferase [Pyronema domesticum]
MSSSKANQNQEGEKIEVDPSVLADDYASDGYNTSTASLTSSLNEYIFENGRRYHAYYGTDKNPMPTDDLEQDRLDIHHELMLRLMDGELHLAPLNNPHRILDVGTGTGIWCIDAADKYPSSEVIGTDLSPIQPQYHFEVDDAELDWTFKDNSFDFIHLRNVAQGIKNGTTCTKPGGWCEMAEVSLPTHCDDDTAKPGNPTLKWCDAMIEAMEKINRPFPSSVQQLTDKLEKAGYVDVNTRCFEAYGMQIFTKALGLGTEEAKKICKDALEDVKKKSTHLYCCFWVAYGRKPE